MNVTRSSEQPNSGRSDRSTAPTHSVPQGRIVSIEHPCIVKNLDNGFKSLGGEPQLKHVLDHQVGDSLLKVDGKTHVLPEPVAGVSLRPHDPLAKKLASKASETRNVLVKVTLPRWTGRKRKRGSDQPFATPSPPESQVGSIRAPELLRRMRDAEGAYSIKPVGMIQETHKFRSQPDFQMHTNELSIISELRDHVLDPSYNALKKLRVDMKPGPPNVTAFPLPPNLIPVDQPYRYEYQQADVALSKVGEIDDATGLPRPGIRKRQVAALAADAVKVPAGPPPNPLQTQMSQHTILECVEQLRALLHKRPMVTKRVVVSALPHFKAYAWPEATERVGYFFNNGPFRDILIQYGIDPRTHPKYRFYQMMTFKFDRNRKLKASGVERTEATERNSAMFDGTTANAKAGSYQICDITDPLLYGLLRTDNIRKECDVHQSGWYHQGTLAKVRVLMRDRAVCVLTGEAAADKDYQAIASLPDELTDDNADSARFDPAVYSAKAVQLCNEYKYFARHYAQRAPRGATESGVSAVNEPNGDLEVEEQDGGVDPELEADDNPHEHAWDSQGGGDDVQRDSGDMMQTQGVT